MASVQLLFGLLICISSLCASLSIKHYVSNSEVDCGPFDHEQSELIFGGHVARKCQYSMAVLIRQLRNIDGVIVNSICTGSIIAPRFVLTAAHCTTFPDFEAVTFYVDAGLYDTTKPNDPNVQTRTVVSVYRHPDYKLGVVHDDIAVLEVDSDFVFNNAVKPASVFKYDYFMWGEPKTVVVGYGNERYENGDFIPSRYRRYSETPLLSNADCIEKMRENNIDTSEFTDKNLCTGWNEGGMLPGDSGGPLVWNLYQVAVSRSGTAPLRDMTNQEKYPAEYTRISPYCDWLEQVTEKSFKCIGG